MNFISNSKFQDEIEASRAAFTAREEADSHAYLMRRHVTALPL
jgi:hypothetical protein